MKHKYYSCSVCKSREFELIYERGVFFDKIYISICKNCGIVCQNPRMDETFFEKYYSSDEYYGHYQPQINESSVYNNERPLLIYNIVKKYLSKSSHILEIGTGRGDNLITLKEKGFINLYGTEINSRCVNSLKKKRIKCFNGNLRKFLKTKTGLFDLIILSHVLEHFVEPDNELLDISELLKETGYLFVLVPNLTSPSNTFSQFTLPHTFYFTKTSLSNLLGICGLSSIMSKQLISSELATLAKKV